MSTVVFDKSGMFPWSRATTLKRYEPLALITPRWRRSMRLIGFFTLRKKSKDLKVRKVKKGESAHEPKAQRPELWSIRWALSLTAVKSSTIVPKKECVITRDWEKKWKTPLKWWKLNLWLLHKIIVVPADGSRVRSLWWINPLSPSIQIQTL